EVGVDGLYLDESGVVTKVAEVGDASPIVGASYSGFVGRPDVNSAHQVQFRADVTGTLSVRGLFLFDPGSATISKVAAKGDTAPPGGSLTKQGPAVLTPAGDSYVLWSLKLTTAKQGIFLYDATPGSALLTSDAPPTDQFGAGSTYKKFFEPRAPRSGSRLALVARVKDTNLPSSKQG